MPPLARSLTHLPLLLGLEHAQLLRGLLLIALDEALAAEMGDTRRHTIQINSPVGDDAVDDIDSGEGIAVEYVLVYAQRLGCFVDVGEMLVDLELAVNNNINLEVADQLLRHLHRRANHDLVHIL